MKNDLTTRIREKVMNNISADGIVISDFKNMQMTIDLVTKCAEKCVYCIYSQKGDHKKGQVMDFELFKKITEEAYELGIRELGLSCTGDPFCCNELDKYIKYVKDLGFSYVYLSTGGIYSYDSLIRSIDAGLDSLKFTISGATAETFRKHHGIDKFELVKQNVIDLYNYRKMNHLNFRIYIFYVVTAFNRDEVELFKEIFEDYCDEIVFSNVQDFVIPLRGLREHLFVGGTEQFKRTIPCADLWNRIVVNVDGYMNMCCGYIGNETKVIDLSVTSLIDAVNCETMQQLRKEHLDEKINNDICKTCLKRKSGITDDYEYDKYGYVDIREDIRKRFF